MIPKNVIPKDGSLKRHGFLMEILENRMKEKYSLILPPIDFPALIDFDTDRTQ